jgi:hypothetical protein
MRVGRLATVLLAVAGTTWTFTALAASPPPGKTGLILHDEVVLRASPLSTAPSVATLWQQNQVVALGSKGTWMHVRIWQSVEGWVPRSEVAFRKPWVTVSTYRAPVITHTIHAMPPRPLHSPARVMTTSAVYTQPGGRQLQSIHPGTTVISSWQQDASGTVWYRISPGWIRATAARLTTPDPARTVVDGVPLWQLASGKGMWLTLGTIADSQPSAIVQAALHCGVTHLYLESAISPLGFHGRSSVGPLLDEAHRHRLKVLAWVYPYLYDTGADVALTHEVAAYRTPSGNRFDGIAEDLERNMTAAAIGTFSQIVRASLGPSYPLVGVTYPAQSLPSYPFTQVARSYNVVAPMDYWHQTKTAFGLNYGHMRYGEAYTRKYAEDSIAAIRRAAPDARIAPIGQVFDDYGHEGMGPYAPSVAELQGFLEGSKADGAIGASFFQWMTATEPEWKTIDRF